MAIASNYLFKFSIKILKTHEFYETYYAAVGFYKGPNLEAFRNRVSAIQVEAIKRLGAIGLIENHDFLIAWDATHEHLLAGPILQIESIRANFVATLQEAIRIDVEPDLWVIHMCVINPENPLTNQFFVTSDGDIVVEKENGWKRITKHLNMK